MQSKVEILLLKKIVSGERTEKPETLKVFGTLCVFKPYCVMLMDAGTVVRGNSSLVSAFREWFVYKVNK